MGFLFKKVDHQMLTPTRTQTKTQSRAQIGSYGQRSATQTLRSEIAINVVQSLFPKKIDPELETESEYQHMKQL